jgi:cell division protein FtsN
MSQKSPKPKKKVSAKRSRFALELTRKELFVWLGVAFLAMGWMFTLGLIVGRGLSPVRFDVEKLKKELIALKQGALKREQAVYKRNTTTLSKKNSLEFYDLLTDKKKQARLKPRSKAVKQLIKPKQQAKRPRGAVSKTSAEVRVRKKDKPSLESSLAKKGPIQGSFTVQALSIKDSARASEMVSQLKNKGYAAYKLTADVPGKGTYYRVRVGHFKDRNKAKKIAARLRSEKFEPIVISE